MDVIIDGFRQSQTLLTLCCLYM